MKWEFNFFTVIKSVNLYSLWNFFAPFLSVYKFKYNIIFIGFLYLYQTFLKKDVCYKFACAAQLIQGVKIAKLGRGIAKLGFKDHRVRAPALQRKSHLCIPFLGIARPQPQFPHSCVCERFIQSQERSTYFLQQYRQTNRGNV